MKKSLISLAIVLVLSMVAALFVPTFAAKSDALVIDWSSADNNTIWPAAGDLPITWAGTPCGGCDSPAQCPLLPAWAGTR